MSKEVSREITEFSLPSTIPPDIPSGDMPTDKLLITADHIEKSNKIFPQLIDELSKRALLGKGKKAVISIFGGSGTGKSEIASVLAYYFANNGYKSYILSGDNYPVRVWSDNNYERLRIYRLAGLARLLDEGLYNKTVKDVLFDIWPSFRDYDPEMVKQYPFLGPYQEAAEKALADYLGSEQEMDYQKLNQIISDFKLGKDKLFLKRMGVDYDNIWYDEVDFSETDFLILEWVHGSNIRLQGYDIGIMLGGSPSDTIEHRRQRKRDMYIDNAYAMTILNIEDRQVQSRVEQAAIIITRAAELVDCPTYRKSLSQNT